MNTEFAYPWPVEVVPEKHSWRRTMPIAAGTFSMALLVIIAALSFWNVRTRSEDANSAPPVQTITQEPPPPVPLPLKEQFIAKVVDLVDHPIEGADQDRLVGYATQVCDQLRGGDPISRVLADIRSSTGAAGPNANGWEYEVDGFARAAITTYCPVYEPQLDSWLKGH